MRIVLDTNVYISAVINPDGTPNKIFLLILDGLLEGCITDHLLDELKEVISRPKIQHILAKGQHSVWLDLIVDDPKVLLTFVPELAPQKNWIPTDPDDNWIIQCALTAQVDGIISGDQDITSLGSHIEGIPIYTPAQFLSFWNQQHPTP